MKLELGSGERPTPGYTHSDVRAYPEIDTPIAPEWRCDARRLSERILENWTTSAICDEIRATHLLEHFGRHETLPVLKDWFFCLKPGGVLYLEVPNFEEQCKLLLSGTKEHEYVVNLAYGGQGYAEDFHKTAFTKHLLETALARAGYEVINVWSVGLVLCARAIRPEG